MPITNDLGSPLTTKEYPKSSLYRSDQGEGGEGHRIGSINPCRRLQSQPETQTKKKRPRKRKSLGTDKGEDCK